MRLPYVRAGQEPTLKLVFWNNLEFLKHQRIQNSLELLANLENVRSSFWLPILSYLMDMKTIPPKKPLSIWAPLMCNGRFIFCPWEECKYLLDKLGVWTRNELGFRNEGNKSKRKRIKNNRTAYNTDEPYFDINLKCNIKWYILFRDSQWQPSWTPSNIPT